MQNPSDLRSLRSPIALSGGFFACLFSSCAAASAVINEFFYIFHRSRYTMAPSSETPRRGAIVALMLQLLLSLSIGSVQAQQYALTCRGGGGTFQYTSSSKTIQFNFLNGGTINTATTEPVLQPGQCTVDGRVLDFSEPRCLVQRDVDLFAVFPLANLANTRASSNQGLWINSFMGFSPQHVFQVTKPPTGTAGCWVVQSS